jgi:hypothetical protein
MQQIIRGDKSNFSLCAMEENFLLFQSLHLTSQWLDWDANDQQLNTLVLSKFGTLFCQELKEFCSNALVSFALMEFASWLDQYVMVAAMIKGGISPTIKSQYRTDQNSNEDLKEWQQNAKNVGASVMERFFNNFPLALATFIVKRVMEMRWLAWKLWKQSQTDNEASSSWVCNSCRKVAPQSYRLCFGTPCMHVMCEICFWKNILLTIDRRGFHENVISCMVCPTTTVPSGATSKAENPSVRRNSSLSKFQLLPPTSRELRLRPKQDKHKKEVLACCWAEGVMSSLGNSQDIRLEKFLSYVERRNTYHYVHGCLVAGVDVNAQNEYGQTPLYLAAWRGNGPLVQLLLEYGADPTVAASGGMSTIQSVCEANGHFDVLKILNRCQGPCGGDSIMDEGKRWFQQLRSQALEVISQPLVANVLIPKSSDHPGAGSYVLDDALSSDAVDQIIELWRRLPMDDATSAIKLKKKKTCCSTRSYFCDAEGWLSSLLMQSLKRADLLDRETNDILDIIFPHMRFLHYEQPGIELAPHVDLSRVSANTELRSTHTFILYLTDCRFGGETVLLQHLSVKLSNVELANISPKRGRLLLFPHNCPHKGNPTADIPKLLVRGEVRLTVL